MYKGRLDEHGFILSSVIDGVAVGLVERKVSAPRTLVCVSDSGGSGRTGRWKQSGCWSRLALRIAMIRLRVGVADESAQTARRFQYDPRRRSWRGSCKPQRSTVALLRMRAVL